MTDPLDMASYLQDIVRDILAKHANGSKLDIEEQIDYDTVENSDGSIAAYTPTVYRAIISVSMKASNDV